MFHIYLIENSIDKSWYIGFTTDIDRRISEHDQKIGGDYTAKKPGKWRLIYSESYLDKKDALGREQFLKSGSGRRFLKKQISNYLES